MRSIGQRDGERAGGLAHRLGEPDTARLRQVGREVDVALLKVPARGGTDARCDIQATDCLDETHFDLGLEDFHPNTPAGRGAPKKV